MRVILSATCLPLLLCLVTTTGFAQAVARESGKPYGNPNRFESAIKQFEAADKEQPPPTGAIVCIGSSSMRGWHADIKEDLAPLTVVPRGFGGSNMNDALHYADRIVLPYNPRAVLVYEGDNDVAQGVAPRTIARTFEAFAGKVHAQFPEARIYFLSIKPSISRWHMWPTMTEANRLIAILCAKDKRLTYLDVARGMLNEENKPRNDIFKEDNLHMTRVGYEIWRDIVRPVLLNAELQFEAKRNAE